MLRCRMLLSDEHETDVVRNLTQSSAQLWRQKIHSVKSFQSVVLSVDFDPAHNHIRVNFRLLWLQKTIICWRT